MGKKLISVIVPDVYKRQLQEQRRISSVDLAVAIDVCIRFIDGNIPLSQILQQQRNIYAVDLVVAINVSIRWFRSIGKPCETDIINIQRFSAHAKLQRRLCGNQSVLNGNQNGSLRIENLRIAVIFFRVHRAFRHFRICIFHLGKQTAVGIKLNRSFIIVYDLIGVESIGRLYRIGKEIPFDLKLV